VYKWFDWDPQITLLRFDASGRLIAKHSLGPLIAHPMIAALPSGEALVVGLAKDGPFNSNSTAILVSPDGKLLRQTGLPELLNFREPVIENPTRNRTHSPMLIPLVNSTGEAFIFREGTRGAIAAISGDLQVSSVVALRHPEGTRVFRPTLSGGQILVGVEKLPPRPSGKPLYAEFNIHSGEMTSSFFVDSADPGCGGSHGIIAFDLVHKLVGELETLPSSAK
jgi:hypothetical protein